MEAANRGASEAKGLNVGLTISISEEFDNPYVSRELHFYFHYFFMRKFWFVYLAKAVVLFPGGLWHARRAVRDPDAGPDRQDTQAHADRALWRRVLGRGD